MFEYVYLRSVCQVFTSAFVYLSKGCFWPDSLSVSLVLSQSLDYFPSSFFISLSAVQVWIRRPALWRCVQKTLDRLCQAFSRPSLNSSSTDTNSSSRNSPQNNTHPTEIISPVVTAESESFAPCPNQTWCDKATFIGAYNCILNIRCLLIGCDCVMSHFHLQCAHTVL